jgi:trigger factor
VCPESARIFFKAPTVRQIAEITPMKVTQEKLPASQIGLQIEITPEMTKQAYEQVVKEYLRSANIPGFRKGKVPRQILVQRIGVLRLKAAALEELVDDSLKKALEQAEIKALGNFQLLTSFEDLITQYEPGSPLTFSASVDVQPDVTVNKYTELQVQAEEIKPDPERVDRVIEQYQEQAATVVPVEGRPAQMKDITVVDYKGVLVSEDPDVEPEEFPGGQGEDFQVELDESKFIKGFVDGIVGMSVGETKDVPVQFPDDYGQDTLAGRPAVFTITLKEIKERELPELDDDFAQEVSEFQTLAELRESLEKRYTEEAEERTQANKEEAILKELLNHVEIDLPETLVDRELTYMLNQTAIQLQNQGLDVRQLFNQDTIPMLKERSRPEAVSRIKRTLALGEIAKQESITVEDDELKAKVDEILADLAEEREIDHDRLRDVVNEDLLKEKIVTWLIEHSTVELVPEGTLVKEEELEELEATPDASENAGSEAVEVEATPVAETVDMPTDVEVEAESAKSTTKKKTTKKVAAEEAPATSESTEEAPAKRKSSRSKKAAEGEDS